jgi:hypothetical protein
MSDINLTAAQEETLRSQVIDATHPGAVLHDFQLVLDYVGEKGVKAGGKYNLLPLEAIPALDPQLARPMRLPLERPQLRSHPYLQGLHLLLRASTLGSVQGKGDKARLVIDPAALRSWNDLNPTERYFSLLEAWLLVAQPAMVGMPGDWGDSLLAGWSYCLELLVESPQTRKRLASALFGRYKEAYNLALADLFGLVPATFLGAPIENWGYTQLDFTPLGAALLTALAKGLQEQEEAEEDQAEEDEAEEGEYEEDWGLPEFGRLQAIFQPYFPAYQKALSVGVASPAREGVYVFKVSLGDVWRRIALAHDHTLDDLVRAILRSVKFDFDHLYAFRYRDALGRTVEANHPNCDDGVPADTVELGTLPLQPGQSMPLVYDFGDSWRFNVKLERIDPPGSVKNLPRVIESHGKAPQQYPDAGW